MTTSQFLDGLALSSIIPAPLIIFSTFVGYLGAGPAGALVMTAAIFLPAFGFTLLGHGLVERLIERRGLHAFLDGVTAGVIGLMAVTTLRLLRAGVHGPAGLALFAAGLAVLYAWRSKLAVPVVVLAAGAVGLLSAALS
jgi:chromate transporter